MLLYFLCDGTFCWSCFYPYPILLKIIYLKNFSLVEVVKKGSVNKGVTESMIFDWIEWYKRIHVNNLD